jgi:hypothetical protein
LAGGQKKLGESSHGPVAEASGGGSLWWVLNTQLGQLKL